MWDAREGICDPLSSYSGAREMEAVDSNFNGMVGYVGGRERGFAEVKRIAQAMVPVAHKMRPATIILGLSATYHYQGMTAQARVPLADRSRDVLEKYAAGRRDALREASDVAMALAPAAHKIGSQRLLPEFIAIIRQLR